VIRDEGEYKVFIDINNVPELHEVNSSKTSLVLGGNINLTRTIEVLRAAAEKVDGFEYAAKISKHIERIANVPIRNVSYQKLVSRI